MPLIIQSPPVPLKLDEHGIARVGATRVTLESVLCCFHDGATAEEIAQKYPSLDLGDVYTVIAFCLKNRQAVDEYIRMSDRMADEVRQHVKWCHPAGLRERLLSRRPPASF